MTRLLVSVRNVAEAHAAVAGGADLVDVKEPANGPLGAASLSDLHEIVTTLAGRVPASAALGELVDGPVAFDQLPSTLRYCKIGLADAPPDWAARLQAWPASALVPVAYADADRVNAPALEAVADWALEHESPYLLVDTAIKDGLHLFDFVEPGRLRRLADRGLRLVLAGSLSGQALQRAIDLKPTYVAVRGAACQGLGGRLGTVTQQAVRRLANQLRESSRRAD